jgi:2-phospho-L-lactate/phosphoenolpyruvate guanylyltransferase
MSAPEIAAVVPVKRLDRALGRLAGTLHGEGRRELQIAMLADVLAATTSARAVSWTLVVTDDLDAAGLALSAGAGVIAEPRPPAGMNGAVGEGLVAAARAGARGALVVMADLPLATSVALDRLVDEAGHGEGVTIATSRDRTGTNAMLLRPPTLLRPELGLDSRRRHLAQASRRGVPGRTVEIPELALDVDTDEDLTEALRAGPAPSTRAACERLGIAACQPISAR